MLHPVAGKSAQNLLCFSRAKTESGGIFDHFVIVLSNEFPLNRSREDRLQVGIRIGLARFGAIELLGMEIFQAREQLEVQKRARRKADLALPVGIDVIAVDLHLGAIAQQAGDHRCDFRRGAVLELRVDADRFALHVPVDEDSWPTIACVPLSHQLLVPGREFLGV